MSPKTELAAPGLRLGGAEQADLGAPRFRSFGELAALGLRAQWPDGACSSPH
jgi:hypothetical protein